jgi:hypothetical protein
VLELLTVNKTVSVFSMLLCCFLLTACGGGGGSGSSNDADTTASLNSATVGLAITDSPMDDWDQAWATINSAELLGDDGKHMLFDSEKTVDLLSLRDHVEILAIDDTVVPGTYSKIRLHVSEVKLVRLNDDGTVDEEVSTKLVANGKIDLNPRGSFDIPAGAVMFITLDFDAERAFKVTQTGNAKKLIVRPVIFVDIGSAPAFRTLARVQGTIESVSGMLDGFLLCDTVFISGSLPPQADDETDSTAEDCFRVILDVATGVFGEDGLPLDPINLAAEMPVTVIGRLSVLDTSQTEPLADFDGDGVVDDDHEVFAVSAFTVEAGAAGIWTREKGLVATDVLDDRVNLSQEADDGSISEIPVQLYPKTRIFTPRGNELGRDALQIDTAVTVDAVLALAQDATSVDELRAALIVVGDDDDTERTSLSGELLSVNGGELMVATDSGDRSVIASDAVVLQIIADGNGLETSEIGLEDLQPGQQLEIFGSEDTITGYFDAEVVIAQPL